MPMSWLQYAQRKRIGTAGPLPLTDSRGVATGSFPLLSHFPGADQQFLDASELPGTMEGGKSSSAESLSGAPRMRSSLPLAALVLLVGAPAAPADLIILKDGFVLQGKSRQEKASILDPLTRQPITLHKFYVIDDGARRFYFSPHQMADVDKTFLRADDTVKTPRKY